MGNVNLEGLGVAIVTPFKKDNSVDFESLERLIEYQIKGEVDYIVCLGTTSEVPTLSSKEKTELTKFVVSIVNKRIPIVVGIGGNNTANVIETIKNYNFDGISAILSVSPYYNKPSQEGIYLHYSEISKISPIPIILYNVPSRTGSNINYETTIRLAENCSNIIATKEASGDLNQINNIIKNSPNGFNVISGDDLLAVDTLKLGAIGLISVMGNAFPYEFSRLLKMTKNKTINDENNFISSIQNLSKLAFSEGNPSGIKAILNLKLNIENVLRLPLTRVTEETFELIRAEMNKLG